MKIAFAAVAALAVLAIQRPAQAREINGVNLDETITVAGKELKLNGAGLRKATVLKVKVYVGALYVETPSKDGAALLATDQTMRVREVFVRSVGRDKIKDALADELKDEAGGSYDKFKERIDKLANACAEMKEGDEMTFTYVPGKGVTFSVHGADVTIEGKDFQQLLFGLWLGPKPGDHPLQDAMLGK